MAGTPAGLGGAWERLRCEVKLATTSAEFGSACSNYLQRDDPFLRTFTARSPRAKSKHRLEALIEINRRGNIIMKYSWWEAGLPDFSLIFATLLLIWVGAFNISKQNLPACNGILILWEE